MTPFGDQVFHTLVEGHGEVEAVAVLLAKLGRHLGIRVPWSRPRRWKNVHMWQPGRGGRGGLLNGLEFMRRKRDVGGVLVLRDEDDGCPKRTAPGISTLIRSLDLPFRTAVVLMHPEYGVLFLPCMHRMQRLGFRSDTRWDGADWEARRKVTPDAG